MFRNQHPSALRRCGAGRPARITAFGLLRARIAGRRDGRHPAPVPPETSLYSQQLVARVHLTEARVGQALNVALTAIDEQMAREGAALATLRRKAAGAVPVPVPEQSGPPSPELLQARRAEQSRRAAQDADDRRIAAHEQILHELSVIRTRLHEEARSLVATYVARHDAFSAAYRRAWWARQSRKGTEPGQSVALAPYSARQTWFVADPPFPFDHGKETFVA